MHEPEPRLPPLLTGHPVRAPLRAFDAAVAGARDGRFGAADLVWGRDTARLDCAIVLEPDVPAGRAAEMLFVALVAFGDCLGALAPPEVAVTYRWPATILLNGARLGRARMAMSPETDTLGAPGWMVVGLDAALRRNHTAGEPGTEPDITDLYEEGCGHIGRTELLEAFSRHFMAWTDIWQDEGFRPVHEMVLLRAEGHREEIELEWGGVRVVGRFAGLDDGGCLILEAAGRTRLLDVLDIAETPAAEAVP